MGHVGMGHSQRTKGRLALLIAAILPIGLLGGLVVAPPAQAAITGGVFTATSVSPGSLNPAYDPNVDPLRYPPGPAVNGTGQFVGTEFSLTVSISPTTDRLDIVKSNGITINNGTDINALGNQAPATYTVRFQANAGFGDGRVESITFRNVTAGNYLGLWVYGIAAAPTATITNARAGAGSTTVLPGDVLTAGCSSGSYTGTPSWSYVDAGGAQSATGATFTVPQGAVLASTVQLTVSCATGSVSDSRTVASLAPNTVTVTGATQTDGTVGDILTTASTCPTGTTQTRTWTYGSTSTTGTSLTVPAAAVGGDVDLVVRCTNGSAFEDSSTVSTGPIGAKLTLSGARAGNTVANGDTVTATPDPASGTTVQWQKQAPGGGSFADFGPACAAGVATCDLAVTGFDITDAGTLLRAQATNTTGTATTRTSSTLTVVTAPGPPTAVTGTSGALGGTLDVTWTAPASNGGSAVTDYVVEYRETGTGPWSPLTRSTSTATTASINGLTPGTDYDLRVAAVNAVGQGAEYGESATPATASPATAPGVPLNVAAVAGGGAALNVTWNAPLIDGGSPITDYLVEIKETTGATWTTVPRIPSTTRSQLITGLTPGTSYQFRISATNAIGTGSPSATSTGVVAPPATVPGAPASVTATTGTSSGTIVITWTPPDSDGGSALTDYDVEIAPAGTTDWATVDYTGFPATSVVATGLVPGASYEARVAARNAVGVGAPTEADDPAVAFNPPPAPPAPPASSPSPTPTPTPSPEPEQPQDPLAPITDAQNPGVPPGGLRAGGSLLLVDGQPVPVRIVPNATRNPVSLIVTGPDLRMTLAGRGDLNDPLGLTRQQVLLLQSERLAPTREVVSKRARIQPVAQSTGDGFKPLSPVRFYLLPSTYLGVLTTDANGEYEGKVPIPPGLKAGVYTLQANGLAPDGAVRSLSIGVRVTTSQQTETDEASVRFAVLSSELVDAARKQLRSLVKRTGTQARTVVSIGFVQPTTDTANDQSLSQARAQSVAGYLRSLGLKGRYVVRGDGRAPEGGAAARRVDVTVIYVPR